MRRKIHTSILCIAAAIVLLMSGCAPGDSGKIGDFIGSRKGIDYKKGVVCVFATDDLEDMSQYSLGSGFGVGTIGEETDTFITNRHVIFDEETGQVQNEVYILLKDNAVSVSYDYSNALVDSEGYILPGTVRVTCEVDYSSIVRCKVLYPSKGDPAYPDIAVLQAEKKVSGRTALALVKTAQGGQLDGSTVYAIGYPGAANSMQDEIEGMERKSHISADITSSTITSGTVSRTFKFPEADHTNVIQHTATINHGNSGGPLINEKGEVIGINTYGYMEATDEIANYNMAIFSDYAMERLDKLNIDYNGRRIPVAAIGIFILAAAVIAAVLLLLQKKKKKPHAAAKSAPGVKPAGAAPGGASAATVPDGRPGAGSGNAGAGGAYPGGRPAQGGAYPGRPNGAVAYRLQGVAGCFAHQRFPIEGVIRIGRAKDSNDLIYPDAAVGVSRRHCMLSLKADGVYLEDLGSSYGTFCNGVRLQPHMQQKLRLGDTIGIGSGKETFLIDSSKKQT